MTNIISNQNTSTHIPSWKHRLKAGLLFAFATAMVVIPIIYSVHREFNPIGIKIMMAPIVTALLTAYFRADLITLPSITIKQTIAFCMKLAFLCAFIWALTAHTYSHSWLSDVIGIVFATGVLGVVLIPVELIVGGFFMWMRR